MLSDAAIVVAVAVDGVAAPVAAAATAAAGVLVDCTVVQADSLR